MISKTKNKDKCTPEWMLYPFANVAEKRLTQGFNRYMRSIGRSGYIDYIEV